MLTLKSICEDSPSCFYPKYYLFDVGSFQYVLKHFVDDINIIIYTLKKLRNVFQTYLLTQSHFIFYNFI